MIEIQGDTVVVDKETTRLEGFRMEDTVKAPVIILFVNDDEPQMLPLDKESTVPVRVKSKNSEAEIQLISYEEIKATLTAR
jgi:hypothetical protein